MELRVQDVVDAYMAGKKLAAMKLKTPVAFWLSRQLRKMLEVVEPYEEQRVALVRQHSEDGTQVAPQKLQAFERAHKELLHQVAPLELEPRPLSFLQVTDIEAEILYGLWMLIVEDPAPPEPEQG